MFDPGKVMQQIKRTGDKNARSFIDEFPKGLAGLEDRNPLRGNADLFARPGIPAGPGGFLLRIKSAKSDQADLFPFLKRLLQGVQKKFDRIYGLISRKTCFFH